MISSQNSFQSQPLPDQAITSSSSTINLPTNDEEDNNVAQSQQEEDLMMDNDLDGEVDK